MTIPQRHDTTRCRQVGFPPLTEDQPLRAATHLTQNPPGHGEHGTLRSARVFCRNVPTMSRDIVTESYVLCSVLFKSSEIRQQDNSCRYDYSCSNISTWFINKFLANLYTYNTKLLSFYVFLFLHSNLGIILKKISIFLLNKTMTHIFCYEMTKESICLMSFFLQN